MTKKKGIVTKMKISIDTSAGFCFGVAKAIEMAEQYLSKGETIYSLGDIVHNSEELERLKAKGLRVISHEELHSVSGKKVLIRAHGEPPETFETAAKYGIELIDATCSVVRKLQQRVGKSYLEGQNDHKQLVIFGKEGHAEVLGLTGHTGYHAVIVSGLMDLDKIDFNRPVILYSQTTMDATTLESITNEIRKRLQAKNRTGDPDLEIHNSICRQVSGRSPKLKAFAIQQDVVIFVSGKKSSNGAYLYAISKEANPNSYFISSPAELKEEWFTGASTIGVTGATSTPEWLMEDVANAIRELI